MATKIKRLTEEERKAELKAYAFSEGLKGFFGHDSESGTPSNSIPNITSDIIAESDLISNVATDVVLETVPVSDSVPNVASETVSETIPISNSIPVLNSLPIPNSILNVVPGAILKTVPVLNSVSNITSDSISKTIPVSDSGLILNSKPISKTIPIKNNTRSENDTYRNNYCIKALRTLKTQNKSLAALGMLFLLRSLLPSSGGRLKIDRIASATGMSKSNILAQLEALENVGLITTMARDISGRLITFPLGIENDTGIENDVVCSSSSFCNKKTTTTEKGCTENETGIEFKTGIENNMGIESNANNKNFDNFFKNRLHNNVISIKFSAQEFFFIAKASKVGIEKLTKQCFKYYHDIKGNMGEKYANGLFLSLLSKAKDNPIAYVVKAVQQGATASPDDEIRAEQVLKAGEVVFKEVGVDILRKELESAFSLLFLNGQSQEMIRQECEAFVARMISE